MKKFFQTIKSAWSRINWQEAKKVQFETALNLFFTVLFYGLTLCCIVALFFGVWWQLIIGIPCYILGAVCLNDTQWGNESALAYLQRVIR